MKLCWEDFLTIFMFVISIGLMIVGSLINKDIMVLVAGSGFITFGLILVVFVIGREKIE